MKVVAVVVACALVVLAGSAEGNSDSLDSLLLLKQQSGSSAAHRATNRPHLTFAVAETGPLRRLLKSRSLRLVKLVDQPSRQLYFGMDRHGTIGLHLRLRSE